MSAKHARTRPYGYQREGAAMIERFGGRALLADSMGLGKSLTSLLWAHRNPHARPILVVCPAALKFQWQREAAHHFGMRAEVLEGMKPPRQRLVPANLVVINYDILRPWLPQLKAMGFQLAIIDECHAISNQAAQRCRWTRDLCHEIPHVIALSGTPLSNRPAELWPVLNLLRPEVFPSFIPFAEEYCGRKLGIRGWDWSGATNLDRLHGELKETCMIRRLKEDVLSELPPKRRIVVPIEIEARSKYDTIKRSFSAWARGGSADNRNKGFAKLGELRQAAARLKMNAFCDWLGDWLRETEEKAIVFAVHHEIVDLLHERFPDSAVLTGRESVRERDNATIAFNQLKRGPRLLIGNIQAAGVGWSCKSSSTVIFAEVGWTPGGQSQAEDRICGVGRGLPGMPASCYYLVARDTIEEKLCEVIQRKQRILESVLDGGDGGDLDIYDALLEEMRKG